MTIFSLGNGWRDLSDEGPGCSINRDKEGWSVVRYVGDDHIKVTAPDGTNVATFYEEQHAVEYVDAMCLASTDREEEIEFLLREIVKHPQWQDTDSIQEMREKYGVAIR